MRTLRASSTTTSERPRCLARHDHAPPGGREAHRLHHAMLREGHATVPARSGRGLTKAPDDNRRVTIQTRGRCSRAAQENVTRLARGPWRDPDSVKDALLRGPYGGTDRCPCGLDLSALHPFAVSDRSSDERKWSRARRGSGEGAVPQALAGPHAPRRRSSLDPGSDSALR